MELTQEQIDKMVEEKILEAKKGLYTEDDLQKKVTSEVDRRVESGIQKGLETQKEKWEREFNEKAKFTAEELAQKQLEEATKNLTAKEKELSMKENLLEAKQMLSGADVPKAQYEKILHMMVSDNAENTKSNVEKFITVFAETKTEIEANVKKTLTKIPPAGTGTGELPKSKTDFVKMTYSEKLKLKQEHPELYKQFME